MNKLAITLRLLPRYLFSDPWKLILRDGKEEEDHLEGLSLADYPLLQEFASMRNFFLVYVLPRKERPFTTSVLIYTKEILLSAEAYRIPFDIS